MKKLALILCLVVSIPSISEELKVSNQSWKNYKKPDKETLKKTLTAEQYTCSQEEGTERPFQNEYWNNHADGIYVDRVSGEPLFSSKDKYDSGSGWPSFTKPLSLSHLTTKTDKKLGYARTEVRSKMGDSHLGHVFDDGPKDKGGLRYCMNSASLRFVAVKDLEKEGYGEFLPLFGKALVDTGKSKTEKAVLAGGCFWGMEELLRKLPGVVNVVNGYTGGTLANPKYELVKTGVTGHAESVEIEFDPTKTNYEAILKFFFKIHDPTTKDRQGNDVGTQYRSAIFYQNDEQKKIAEKVLKEVDASGKWKKPLVTQIVKGSAFYPAEDYHQDYLEKNPGGYTCHFIRE